MKNELSCDALLSHPGLATPPDEPPPPPYVKPVRRKMLIFPPRFPLIDVETYNAWVNHRKELAKMTHIVDDSPPELFPELYLKPRRLDAYARQIEEHMMVNNELLKKINCIQRTGGYVDCWMKLLKPHDYAGKLLCKQRQRVLDEIHKSNIYLYKRLITARSDMLLTKELDEEWKETKKKLILGASLPFILFKTETIDRGIIDPNFDKPAGVYRDKVTMDMRVEGGSKVGKVYIELFNEVVPKTCALFLSLVKGDGYGYGYRGTCIFRIVPDLYCRGGDVVKNNGFGCYMQAGREEPMTPENYILRHSVPGVLSMAVLAGNEVCGQFNIIFKPLKQLDGHNVVFGRIVNGPPEALGRIGAMGLPLGAPINRVEVRSCGARNKRGRYVQGARNTMRFAPSRHK